MNSGGGDKLAPRFVASRMDHIPAICSVWSSKKRVSIRVSPEDVGHRCERGLEHTFGLRGTTKKRGHDQFLANRKLWAGDYGDEAWLRARESYQLVGHHVSKGVVGS